MTELHHPGELNAASNPRRGGTLTRDPEHGKNPDDLYHPLISNTKTDDQVRDAIRSFAQGFRGSYSLTPFGPNCRTFISDLTDEIGLIRPQNVLNLNSDTLQAKMDHNLNRDHGLF